MVIYRVINPQGKSYIGQTVNFERRKQAYKNLQCHGQVKLYRSFKKYGYNNHIFEILETCIEADGNEKERFYQEKFNVLQDGLNLKLTETKDKSGRLSEETRQKISESNKGRTIKQESIEKMLKTRKERGVNRHSEETKRKISESLKGHPVSEETLKKMSEARKGVPNLKLGKPVEQFSLEGELIATYPSLSEAKRQTGIANIIKCIKGIYKTSGGFIWRYVN